MESTAKLPESALGVYVSVPFCRAKCSFCNFASGVNTDAEIASYVTTLCAEVTAARETARRVGGEMPSVVDTIYFGGGTPSLLSATQLQQIFGVLRDTFDVSAAAEITLEAAPGQITPQVLEAALQLGVNRVSLGVQSFVDAESAAVGRTHTGASCAAEIARLRGAGVREVAADLIAGLPHQSHASWQVSLEAAVATAATHWSVYMLEVDEDSRLGREVLQGGLRLHAPAVPSADASADMYESAREFFELNGFAQYEISNFARAGSASRHNRKYWERKPYMGFGLDAHSMLRAGECSESLDAVRFANTSQLADYGEASWGREVTLVNADGAFEEALFLGLRLNAGVDVARLREDFGASRVSTAGETVRELVQAGLMRDNGNRWSLNARGRMVSNEVFERLLFVAA